MFVLFGCLNLCLKYSLHYESEGFLMRSKNQIFYFVNFEGIVNTY